MDSLLKNVNMPYHIILIYLNVEKVQMWMRYTSTIVGTIVADRLLYFLWKE